MAKHPTQPRKRPGVEEQRKRVLLAARVVLSRQGIEETTVEHVIAQAGMSRATFYRCYSSLDDVILALYRDFEEHVKTRLTRLLGPDAFPAADWRAVIDGVIDDARALGGVQGVLFREELRPRSRARKHLRRRVNDQTKMIAEWWQAGTGQPAHGGLIRSFIYLLQIVGLHVATDRRLSEAEIGELKDAAAFIVEAVVLRYLQHPDARPPSRS